MAVTEDLTFRMNFVGNAVPQMQRVERQLKRVSAQTDRATRTLNRHAGQYNRTSVMTNKWAKGALQQAGYQVGDFAVQVANGTSKMQAFGQQGSQLLGIFGPIGAVLGAGVAIFSALSVAASKSGRELGDLAAVLGVFRGPLESVVNSVRELTSQFGGVFQFLVSNIDTAIISLISYVALVKLQAIRNTYSFATSMHALGLSVGRAGGAMYALGFAVGRLIKIFKSFFLIGLAVFIGNMITGFFRLVKGAGSFGDALELVGQAAVEVFRRIGVSAFELGDALSQTWTPLKNALKLAIADMLSDWAGFINVIATSLANAPVAPLKLFGESMRVGLSVVTTEAERLRGETMGTAEAFNAMAGAFKSALSGVWGEPIEALEKIKELIAAGTEDVKLFGGAIEDLDDEGGAGGALTEMQKRIKSIADTIQSSLSDAFMSMVDGTKTAKEAFKDMARAIIKKLFEVLVVQRAVNALMRAIGFGTAPGTTGFSMFTPPSFDGGGYTGSGGRSGGIDGKGGFPAILHPNETVIDHTKGGSAGGVVVNQTINVSTGVQQTVRTEIKTMMPMIADAAKAAVADAKRRGEMGFA